MIPIAHSNCTKAIFRKVACPRIKYTALARSRVQIAFVQSFEAIGMITKLVITYAISEGSHQVFTRSFARAKAPENDGLVA